MGGENEVTVPQSQSTTTNLRIHTSGGEIHFHDDVNKIKAAVPVSTWFKVYSEFTALQRHTWEYLDTANQSILTVQMTVTDDLYDMILAIKKVKIGPTLTQMQVHAGKR